MASAAIQNEQKNQFQISNFLAKEFFDYGLMSFYSHQQNQQSKENGEDKQCEEQVQGGEQIQEDNSNILISDKDLQLKYKDEIEYIRWFHKFHKSKISKQKKK